MAATNIENIDDYLLNNHFPPHTSLQQAITLLTDSAQFIKTPIDHPVRLRIQKYIEQQKNAYLEIILNQINRIKDRLKKLPLAKTDPIYKLRQNKLKILSDLYLLITHSDREITLDRLLRDWVSQDKNLLETLKKHEYPGSSHKSPKSFTALIKNAPSTFYADEKSITTSPSLSAASSSHSLTIPSNFPFHQNDESELNQEIEKFLTQWSEGSVLAEHALHALIQRQSNQHELLSPVEQEKKLIAALREYSVKTHSESFYRLANLFIFIEKLNNIPQKDTSDEIIYALLKKALEEWHQSRTLLFNPVALLTERHPATGDSLFLNFLKNMNPAYKHQNDTLINEMLSWALGCETNFPLTHSTDSEGYSAADVYALANEHHSLLDNEKDFTCITFLLNLNFKFNRVPPENNFRKKLQTHLDAKRQDYLALLLKEKSKIEKRRPIIRKEAVENFNKNRIAALDNLYQSITESSNEVPLEFTLSQWFFKTQLSKALTSIAPVSFFQLPPRTFDSIIWPISSLPYATRAYKTFICHFVNPSQLPAPLSTATRDPIEGPSSSYTHTSQKPSFS